MKKNDLNDKLNSIESKQIDLTNEIKELNNENKNMLEKFNFLELEYHFVNKSFSFELDQLKQNLES